jgi:hypothetical protein
MSMQDLLLNQCLLFQKTHGIIIPSFYHMTPLGRPLKTISGRYQHWYPASTFDKKIAQELIDIELAKKVAIYLSGDPSGKWCSS